LDPNFLRPLQADFAKQLGYADAPYIRSKVDSFKKKDRPIQNKYVMIGLHSTAQLKYWNHPNGMQVQRESPNWNELCDMLRKVGITPVVAEKDELFGKSPYFNGMPRKAQRKLGLSLIDTINLIEHAEFFIGLSSGLAWLAHGLGQKVAMIANFSEDWYEFDVNSKDYVRIKNVDVCHGCWNRVGLDYSFDKGDWYWCKHHKGTPRQFECHTSITPTMVFESIKKWL
jgi:autotransporter strand-loop-strand O-heptosyltransferase